MCTQYVHISNISFQHFFLHDHSPQEYTTMKVLVPAGMKAGDRVRIKAPSGTHYTVAVPSGYAAGDRFLCNVPR